MAGSTVHLPNGDEFWLTMDIPKGELPGILILVVVSIVSSLAVILLLGAIAISAWNTRHSSKTKLFVRSHAAGYLVSLLICDLLQATGSLMNARWYMDQAVQFESFCVAQGVIKQLADVGTAIWASVIASHTFWVLFLRWPLRRPIMIATMVFAWSAIAAFVITGPATLDVKSNGPFFGISGYWCWISPEYPVARVTLDYLFMFIAGFLTSALYILVFLRLRGNILYDGSRGLRFRVHHRSDVSCGLSADDHTIHIAKQMLLYPAAYIALLVPIAICRFAEWSGHNIPFSATIFSDTVFLLSGSVNVLMFVFTRRVLPRHSIITKRFRKDTCQTNSEASSSAVTTTTLNSFVLEDEEKEAEERGDLDDKVFMRVDSPDGGDETMIPVHLASYPEALPYSPPTVIPSGIGQESFSEGISPGPRTSTFPASATALMTYPQSPLPTR